MKLETITVVRRIKIRYCKFDGLNADYIGEFIESKNPRNSVDFTFHSRKGYMRVLIDNSLKEIHVGDYVVWDIYAQRVKVLSEEDFKEYTRNE